MSWPHASHISRCTVTLAMVLGAAALQLGAGTPVVRPSSPATGHSADTLEVTRVSGRRPTTLTVTFPRLEDPDRPLMVLDPRLEERIVAMAQRSAEWLDGLLALRERRFPVLIGSILQVEERLPALKRLRYDGPAAVWIFRDAGGEPAAAAVTINMPKLVIRNRVLGGDEESLERMLELHLAHEIYGHLVPVVESRDPAHPCGSDPEREAPPAVQMQSCVMQRESRLLEDLGYEPRESYLWDYWGKVIEPSGS